MSNTYEFTLDGLVIPTAEKPARGPIAEFDKRRWARQDVIGDANPGTILTLLGTSSPDWEFESRAETATKDKYIAVYEGEVEVVLKTPQNAGGFNVIMEKLTIQHETPIEDGKWLCRFTLVKR